jgi:hypothetical protein
MQQTNVTKLTCAEHVLEVKHAWMETVHNGFHKEDIGLLTGGNHAIAFVSSSGKWFFA